MTTNKEHPIKHLVISGGAHTGFIYYGCVKSLFQQNILSLDQLETFYGTSIGAYVIVYLLLGYDWEALDNYLINRPWHHIFKIDMDRIMQAFPRGGLFNRSLVEAGFEPVFKGKDVSMDITLLEFYKLNQKEFHLITTDFYKLETVDLSYKTHPQIKLIDALYATSCLPVVFEPCRIDTIPDTLFIDGAAILNYPLYLCMDAHQEDHSEILGIYLSDGDLDKKHTLQENSFYRLLEFLFLLMIRFWLRIKYIRTEYETRVLHQIPIQFSADWNSLVNTCKSSDERGRLVRLGDSYASNYVDLWTRDLSHNPISKT